MDGPDARARATLRAYRQAKSAPATQADALWDRIESSLDEGVEDPCLEELPAAGRRSAGVLVAAAAVVVAVGAVAGLGGLRLGSVESSAAAGGLAPDVSAFRAAIQSSRSRAPKRNPVRESDESGPDPASVPSPQTPERSRSDAPPRIPSGPARSRRSGAEAPRGVSEPASDSEDALQAEMSLIGRARRALHGGRADRALTLLRAHAEAFADGQMREDRQALRIEALCAVGKGPQARAEAAAFARRFPRSAHAARVSELCPRR